MGAGARIVCIALLCAPAPTLAQDTADVTHPWLFRARAVISGTSGESDPAGYKIYSGIGLEAAVVRELGDVAALELSFRTESREVTGSVGTGLAAPLGSLEMLPINVLLHWRPRGRHDTGFQPYIGAGLNVTVTWEKSGALDSSEVPSTLGPAVALGADFPISTNVAFNLHLAWNTLTVDIEDYTDPTPSMKIDPLALGLGLTFRIH